MKAVFRRLRYSLGRSRHVADLREEIEAHRALRQDALERDGLASEDAARASRRALGNVVLAVDEARDVWTIRTVDSVWQDVRAALRGLRKSLGFAFVAIGTLALGIGANATMFSVISGVLAQPLPYEAQERIGIIWHDFGEGAQSLPVLNPLDLYDYREWSRAFERFTLAVGDNDILGVADGMRTVDIGLVEAGFFEFFGVRPLLGRAILAADDRPGAAAVALLSHRLWSTAFGGDPQIVGRVVELGGEHHQVIGVLPADFRLHLPAEALFMRDAEIWTAARINRRDLPARNFTAFTAFGRIRAGTTFAEAQADLDRMEARLKERHAVHAEGKLQVRIVPLKHDVVKHARDALVLLFAAVGLVLAVACANVANLLLVRGRVRESELAIRIALGAARGRIFGLVFSETLLLAAVGGALGLGVAAVGVEVVRNLGRASVPRLDAVVLNGGAVGFVITASLAAALVAGLVPAWRAAADRRSGALLGHARSSEWRSGVRFRDALVLAEVALTVLLLIGAGLMVRSFWALHMVDPGFSTENVLTFRVSLADAEYPDDEHEIAFYRAMQERISALPGVRQVAAISQLPLTGSGPLQPYAYDEETARNWESVTADRRWIAPGFFRAMGATLLAGREFTPTDVETERELIVIDDRLAERAFGGRDPVGQRLQIRPNDAPDAHRYAEVIGVVSHLRLHDLARQHLTQIYWPMRGSDQFTVVARTSVPAATLAPAVRRQVALLGSGVAVEDLRSIEALVSESLAPVRLSLLLMLLFGIVSLALASVGLYAVVAFTVRQRTREIGIRIALGQTPAGVRRSIFGHGMRLVVIASTLGAGMAAALGRAGSAYFFGVDAIDPVTYVTVTVILAAAAALACWIPSRRATTVNPIKALGVE